MTLGLAVGLALGAAGSGWAHDPCIGDAQAQFADCKGESKEAFQVAKDGCWNREHDCVEACRAGREECTLATGLDDDLSACRNTLRGAKDVCRAENPTDPLALDDCIDRRQVEAFLCRKAARVAAKPLLSLCRLSFRTCARACPTVGDVVIDKAQCQVAAKNDYIAAKADCREQFQTQKDACLNRDHACVEGCRAQRDTCREPIENNLDTAIGACNTVRDSDIAACNGDATCITAAQVAAFTCRDAARELARPGFDNCRDAFQTCVAGVDGVGGCALN
jgi:hypothetical protein